MRFIKYIVIHCSAGFGSTKNIIKYWKEVNKWKQVGYHFHILTDGTVDKLVDLDTITNGVQGYNTPSIHICYQGGINKESGKPEDTRTNEQKEAILKVIKEVLEELKQYQDISDIKILGHRDFSPDLNKNGIIEKREWVKECPSFDAKEEYSWLWGNKAIESNRLL